MSQGAVGNGPLLDAAIDTIIAALPSNCRPEKVALLSKILRDWSDHHIGGYGSDPPERLQARTKHFELLSKLAHEFLKTLAALEIKSSKGMTIAIEWYLSAESRNWVTHSELDDAAEARRRVAEDWLAGLGDLFAKSRRGRPRGVRQRLVMLDLAVFWEYVTDTEASRRVRGKDHSNRGQEYGLFWDFARAVWPAIFGSQRGLSAAMRIWAAERAKRIAEHKAPEYSALISVALRHPEWRIFDS
jgi:hypothetical protein